MPTTNGPEPKAIDPDRDAGDGRTLPSPQALKVEPSETNVKIKVERTDIEQTSMGFSSSNNRPQTKTENDSDRTVKMAPKKESPKVSAKIKTEQADVTMSNAVEEHSSLKNNPYSKAEHGHDDIAKGESESDSSEEECDDPKDGDFLVDSGSPESDGDTDSDEESQPTSKSKKEDEPSHPKVRRSPAKDAREYWTRWNEEDTKRREARLERKRKRESNDNGSNGPRKSQKIAKSDKDPPQKEACETSPIEEAPIMPAFEATTHKEQFEKIRANMAKGGDTRHTATQERDVKQAAKSFGFMHVKAANSRWKLARTMRTGLMNYQLTITSWMCKREVCGEPQGGLIADEMGMGKTVVSLACMAEHQADKLDAEEYSKATLVVVPNRTIANQWASEIRTHCKSQLADKVLVHPRQGDKPRKRHLRNRFAV